MKYGIEKGPLVPALIRPEGPLVVAGVFDKSRLSAAAEALDKASGGYVRTLLKQGEMTGKPKQTLLLHHLPHTEARALLVGLGEEKTLDDARFLGAARTVIGALRRCKAARVICCLLEAPVPGRDSGWKLLRLMEQFAAGLYRYTRMKGKPPEDEGEIGALDFLLHQAAEAEAAEAALARGLALAKGLAAAKDLANTPANICHPDYLAIEARRLAKAYPKVSVKTLEEKEMEKMGMGAFMSVSRGSERPGKLIVMQYKGAAAKDRPHVLVGKGITFDTGGISLKPGANMHEMIYDMCGAASVFGTVTAIAEQGLPINLVGVVAAAENMPSGKASRPGDIVKSLSGQTVEILNTDAEGRLVLCDALTYIARFKPETVVDIATLTGACVIALGKEASALYANDEDLAAALVKAGQDSFDRVWRMPLWEEYQSLLNSAFADMANIGGREAGSVTAACFLARFTKEYRWAHLDIAGTAYKGSGMDKGASGRPVSLLVEYLNGVADAAA